MVIGKTFISRLERVLNQVMRTLPVLSSGEKNMQKELESMNSNVTTFVNQLTEIKAKDSWQTSQVSDQFIYLREMLVNVTCRDIISRVKFVKEVHKIFIKTNKAIKSSPSFFYHIRSELITFAVLVLAIPLC